MTKMKSKKMTKSTFAIIIMGIIMVAMLAFGGTFAYFTATATQATNTVTTATVYLKNGNTDNKLTMSANATNLLPYDKVTAGLKLENTNTTVATWIFLDLSYSLTTDGKGATGDQAAAGTSDFKLSKVECTEASFKDLEISGENIWGTEAAVASTVKTLNVTLTFTYKATSVNENGAGTVEMNATYTIEVDAFSIQDFDTEGEQFESALDAYNQYKEPTQVA